MCHRAIRENRTLLQGAYGRSYFRGRSVHGPSLCCCCFKDGCSISYQFLQGSWQSQGTLYLSWHGREDGIDTAATFTPALRLPESVRLKGCLTFLKSYKGSSAHPAESWQDGRGGLFRSMKCGCCSLPYFSRNSETRPSSLGHHEKKNFFSTSNRQKREHELAQIFFLWKHCMSLFNLDSLTAWKIIPWK